ncbi:hypothetical protein ALC57_06702 [Trachymyrmex cornetzi]|uniref:Uncharacterized protein n=1 Tax=Trachymyrmex cornetzi TaxID=471704 RepID=A0A195E6S9_9HYME|nr:hypothetical protein ALC57_06702 [Trachymyrmex cornetzi]
MNSGAELMREEDNVTSGGDEVPRRPKINPSGTSKRGQTNGGGGLGKGPTDAMQFGHGTQSDDVTNRPKALFVVGHCMLSHWFTSSLHTITLYRHTETFRNGTSNDLTRVRCRYCEIRRSARRWLYTAPRGKGRGYRDEE